MTTEVKEWHTMPSIKECLAVYEKQDRRYWYHILR